MATSDEYFLGYGRVSLSALEFEQAKKEGHREESTANTDRLFGIFQKNKCQNQKQKHAIPAIINKTLLSTFREAELPKVVKESKNDDETDSINTPMISIQKLECLNGLHRIAAGKRCLDTRYWWTIEFYSDGKKISSSQNCR
jgi:hypothetical protein